MKSVGKTTMLNVEDLEYDINNPRIAYILDLYEGDPNPAQVAMALGYGGGEEKESATTFTSLRESIKTNNGLIHPIIVNKNDDGSLVVIEGNTRLAIYKDFKKKGIEGDWDEIPAIVHDNLDDSGIDSIRLQAHLVGPRPWNAYSKAKYLNKLSKCSHLTLHQIVEFCGGKKRQVEDYIGAYNDMEEFYRPLCSSEDDFDQTRFSSFVELQKPKIKSAILRSGYSLTDFSKWIYDKLLKRNEHVRDLPRVLSNEESKKIFLKDGIQEALKVFYTEKDMDLEQIPLEKLTRVLYEKLVHIEFAEVLEMKANQDSDKTQNLLDLLGQLQVTCEYFSD